jgi:CRISPR-associated protein Csb2
MQLCLSITSLTGCFHGLAPGGEPEWPPAPFRVFQALVAAAAAEGPGPEWARATFGWLERQAPPKIIAPRPHHGRAYLQWVPHNHADLAATAVVRGTEPTLTAAMAAHRTAKTVQPTWVGEGAKVHYVWSIDPPSQAEASQHVGVLALIAQRLTVLGRGIDLVMGSVRLLGDAELEQLPGQRWCPGSTGPASSLRVPVCGTFQGLLDRHRTETTRLQPGLLRPVGRSAPCRTLNYTAQHAAATRPYAAFVFRPVEPRSTAWQAFPLQEAVSVAGMLRHAAIEAALADPADWRDADWARSFVAGHGPRERPESFPRFSYLPLPSIGHTRADRLIRRALVAESGQSTGQTGQSAAWISAALSGARLQPADPRASCAIIEPVQGQALREDSVFRRYLGAGGHDSDWVSVTPVILPGYDDGKPAKRRRLLARCLEHAGLSVSKMECSRWPHGAGMFRRPSYLQGLPGLHLRLRNSEPIGGPVALGAGRHCGLGVFAAVAPSQGRAWAAPGADRERTALVDSAA